jgi:hypothetical protein
MNVILDTIRQHNLEDNIVRVILQADVETEAHLRDNVIQDALQDAKVSFVAGVHKEVDRPTRRRLGTRPEGMTSLELLRHYFLAKQLPEDRIKLLLERAEEMLNDT